MWLMMGKEEKGRTCRTKEEEGMEEEDEEKYV